MTWWQKRKVLKSMRTDPAWTFELKDESSNTWRDACYGKLTIAVAPGTYSELVIAYVDEEEIDRFKSRDFTDQVFAIFHQRGLERALKPLDMDANIRSFVK